MVKPTQPVDLSYLNDIIRPEAPPTRPKSASDILREAAQTYEEKNKVYGDNFLRVGAAMAALFPDGVTLKTEQDWNRMHIYLLAIVKMSRYAVNWGSGHQDSIRDATVYCAMLEMIDQL